MTVAPLRRAAVEGYRRLLMPLGFGVAVLLLSAATAVLVALPLYAAATRATPVYNALLGILAAASVITAVGRGLLKRARPTGDVAGYARRLVVVSLWSLARLLLGVAAVVLSLLAFRIGPVAGTTAAVAALAAIGLLIGFGRASTSPAGKGVVATPSPPSTAS